MILELNMYDVLLQKAKEEGGYSLFSIITGTDNAVFFNFSTAQKLLTHFKIENVIDDYQVQLKSVLNSSQEEFETFTFVPINCKGKDELSEAKEIVCLHNLYAHKEPILSEKQIKNLRIAFKLKGHAFSTIEWFNVTTTNNYCNISSGLRHADGITQSPLHFECSIVGEDCSLKAREKFTHWLEKKLSSQDADYEVIEE